MLTKIEHGTISKADYIEQLRPLQFKLMMLQQALTQQQKRCVIVVEGMDAAGKGGLIRRTTDMMATCGYRVHPTRAPNTVEIKEHYLQRFWARLPKPGQIAIFDRSWYGRILVERVEGLISETVWQRAFREIIEFEQQLYEDGIIMIKLFLAINKDEQFHRFTERLEMPHKRWKLTADDIHARLSWDDYQTAYSEMLLRTDCTFSPWCSIGANQKFFARISAMTHISDTLSCYVDIEQAQARN